MLHRPLLPVAVIVLFHASPAILAGISLRQVEIVGTRMTSNPSVLEASSTCTCRRGFGTLALALALELAFVSLGCTEPRRLIIFWEKLPNEPTDKFRL